MFVGSWEGGQKHHRLVFIIKFYIDPQQVIDNFIERVDVLSQIRTLCHLKLIQFLLKLKFIYEGLGHIPALQLQSYSYNRHVIHDIVHKLVCQT